MIILILKVVHVALVHFQRCGVWIYPKVLIHPSVDRRVGCFYFRVIIIMLLGHGDTCFWYTYARISFGYIFRNGTSG